MTRAEPGASRTAADLRALGFDPVAAPVLAVRPIPQPAPSLDDVAALAFTSVNGVEAFAALTPDRTLPVFAVGDVTAAAARAAGFGEVASASGAIDDLVRLLARDAPGPVLAPGALEPAGDFGVALQGQARVRRLAVYRAGETGTPAPDRFDAVLAHSPKGARAIALTLGPGGGAGRVAVAISAAAAAPLEAAGFVAVRIAAEPTGAAMLQALGKPAARV